MKREIEVYNTHFGDCIVLKDNGEESSNLLVDFGIHFNSVINYKPYCGNRDSLTKDIAEDIAERYSQRKLNLLITHFHEDHVSGLIYMYKSKDKRYKYLFSKIYIANIWNNHFAIAISFLEQLILSDECKKGKLPRTNNSLLDLVEFLCVNISHIQLLSRGEKFENDKYITLWPLKDNSKEDDEKDFDEIKKEFNLTKQYEKKLISLSRNVCNLASECISTRDKHDSSMLSYVEKNIDRMKEDYFFLQNESYTLLRYFKEDGLSDKITKLNEFNHKYNIVFQNTQSDEENVLFTGDMECSQMKYIETQKDITLYKHYKYIKIPHHGTENHGIDFSKYSPENVIITNGKVNINNSASYEIDTIYGNLNARHLCTNSNNCKNCQLKCTISSMACNKKGNRILVFNKMYKGI